MSVFEIAIDQGSHCWLRVKQQGALWPWCYALRYALPNAALFFELIEEARASTRFARS